MADSTASRSPAARNLLGLIERLAFVRSSSACLGHFRAPFRKIAFQRLVGESHADDGTAFWQKRLRHDGSRCWSR